MTDRTTLEIYQKIFQILDQNMTTKNEEAIKKIATDVYVTAFNYDFNFAQLNAKDALKHLDLEEKVTKDHAW